MPTPTDPNPPNRNAPAGLFGIFLFSAMVGAVCAVAILVLTEDRSLIGAIGIGGALAVGVGIALAILLRNPAPSARESRTAFEPRSTYRKGTPDDGQAVGGAADARPTTTQDTLAVGGATGGQTDVAVAPTAAARSPGEPAERPVPGAGAPGQGVAASVVEAAQRGGGGGAASETDTSAGGSVGSGDPGGVDPTMPRPDAGSEAPSGAEAAEVLSAGAGRAERHGGGGDPGGVDAEMPDADAPAGETAEEAARAFSGDGAAEQVEPARLDAPREGGPDDFKRIRGVGPVLEEMLHGMGIYHFDQIAGWGPGEVAWADDNLQGFKGRVSRDDWVGQARELASGGTEFAEPHVNRS